MLDHLARQRLPDLLFGALLLFAGAEVFSLSVGGVTVKYVQIVSLLAVTAVWAAGYRIGGFDRRYVAWVFALLGVAGMSVGWSVAPLRTIAYVAYLAFSLLVVGAFVFAYVLETSWTKLLRVYFVVNRAQVVLLLGQAVIIRAIGSSGRPSLWFYEPSYMSVSVVGYFSAALFLVASRRRHGVKRPVLDVALAILALLPMASFLGIASCFIMTAVVLAVTRRYKLLFLAPVVVAALVGVAALAFAESDIYRLNFARFVEQAEQGKDVLYILASRSGTRVARLIIGLHAIRAHWLTGVGLAADADYSWTLSRSVIPSEYVWAGTEPLGAPFVNPFVEMFGTMGILGLAWLLGSIAVLSVSQWRCAHLPDREHSIITAMLLACMASFVGLQVEGTLFRFYFLISVMILFAVYRKAGSEYPRAGPRRTRRSLATPGCQSERQHSTTGYS